MPLFNFDQVAEQYDFFYETLLGREIDHVEKQLIWQYMALMSLANPVLEIGCGTGHWTRFFQQKGLKLTAIDISVRMLEKAKIKNPGSVHFERMDVENMTYKDHSFDNIVSIATLEFVDHKEQAIKEIFRVLKPGGSLVVGCLNELSETGLRKEENEVYRNAQFFTPDSLIEYLSLFGKPQIDGCAIIEEDRVLDFPDINQIDKQERLKKGAFLSGYVKKYDHEYYSRTKLIPATS
jgi:ubiquinone/menaquinone biosynthesis C-methylase UbiE